MSTESTSITEEAAVAASRVLLKRKMRLLVKNHMMDRCQRDRLYLQELLEKNVLVNFNEQSLFRYVLKHKLVNENT